MRDLQRAAGAARDGDRLVDRLEQAVVLVAHVGRVGKPELRQRLAELDQLFARRERAGRVLEPRGDAARAVGERLFHQRAHARELGRRRRSIRVADDDSANRAEAHHRRDVHRRLQTAERGPQVREAHEPALVVVDRGVRRGRGVARRGR
jgi:hypothetical protein